MIYVVIILIVLAVIFGVFHSRKLKKQEEESCTGFCSSCPHHNDCGTNDKK